MPDNPAPEEAIFAAAIELPTAERAAYLDRACGGDAGLRQSVEALLKSHEEALSFLENPPPDVALTRTIALTIPPTEKIGDRIGRYKLLQQIGEGGCGVVYMAEQLEPVRRQVALKVIKLGMDTKQVIARFEAERQALALMDHPNIAKVLDAGATEMGRPYFVMELVRGIKITEFCDKNHLTTPERLKLFVQVCQAVQHAHQKGIIHRDLKPSNILVTLNDGVPMPKVIDFGIAKATQERLTDKTLFTAFEQFIGTPAYMSPEQAEMNAQGVDTRSDIYSLGVLLYELLTSKTPFDTEKLLQAGVNEIRRIIREEEPVKPSTKLSTLLGGELTATAHCRQTAPPKLIHTVRGELDWIVMKCLEKDRARRYETANGLALDIQRHLNYEPVAARPPSELYRMRKLVRRNKVFFSAAGIVIAALIIGFGASAWMFLQEKKANQEATAAEQEQSRLRELAQNEQTKEKRLLQEAEVARTHEAKLRQDAENARANEALLRQQVEFRLQMTEAQNLFDSGKPEDAKKMLDGIRPELFQPASEEIAARRLLAWEYAKEDHWAEAVSNYAVVVQRDDPRWNVDIAGDQETYLDALVIANDLAAYDHYRQNLVTDLFRTNDIEGSEFICGLVLLTPADPAFMQSLVPFVKVASEWNYSGVTNPDDLRNAKAGKSFNLALVAYRNGDYTNALAWSADCLAQHPSWPQFPPCAHAVRAMALYRLAQVQKAKLELNPAKKAVDAAFKKGGLQGYNEGGWFFWHRARIYLNEAEKLLSDSTAISPPSSPPAP